jgi:multidrug efflux pump
MKLTERCIRRPVLAIVITVVIVIAGLQAVRSLNIRQYPKLESASITVRTQYAGADAELVRSFVTTPLERAIAAADGIDVLESETTQGLSSIHARLKLNFPAASALADISARVNQVRADLPPGAELPAINLEPSDSQFAALYVSFGSEILAANQLTDYLIRAVQPRLSAIPGVQRAEILGGSQFAVRVWLDPDRMMALQVNPASVSQALARNNYLSAVGQTKGQLHRVSSSADTDLHSAEDFQQLVIRRQNGALVRLRDIAEVQLGAESYDQDVRLSGRKEVFMGIWVLPNANSLDVIERTRAELEAIERDLPSGVRATVAFDSTHYIHNAIHEVVWTLLETVLIVILVLFAFLGSLRSVLVPLVAIPLSLIGAVFLIQVCGFTINLLTLLAIVLSVGLVVDDAIVVVENVQRHIVAGRRPVEAATLAARELVGPIVAMTATLAAAYIPVGFQGGLTGALFREFAFTLAGAVLVSGVVALTLSPMMSARLLRPAPDPRAPAARIARGFEALRHAYRRALEWMLQRRPATYALWLVLSLAIIPMYLLSPEELAPNEDQGVVFSALDVPPNATLERLEPYAEQLHEIYASVPEFQQSFQLLTPDGGFSGAIMKPWQHRERSIFPIQIELSQRAERITGVRPVVFLPPPLPNAGLLPVEFVISSTAEHAELLKFAEQLQQAAESSGEFYFPLLSDVRFDEEKNHIRIDRDRAASMGLSMEQVGADLSALLGGDFVNRFNLDGRSYKVIAQVQRRSILTPEQLLELPIAGPGGSVLQLGAIAQVERGVGARSLNRFQQLNSVKLSSVPTRSLDACLRVLEQKAAEILPPGYRVDYGGESRQLRQEAGKFLPALGLALALIFLALAVQFNSFRDPLVVLAGSVPLALFGGLIFTFLYFWAPPGLEFPLTRGWTTTLNIYSQVGFVTLVGLIAKNGILIVEFANAEQARGESKQNAVLSAAATRLRPILMTTVATVLGHFPLTLVAGPGAVARNSIGIVLVGGMSIGTVFTLFVVPCLYVLIARDHGHAPFDERDAEETRIYRQDGLHPAGVLRAEPHPRAELVAHSAGE